MRKPRQLHPGARYHIGARINNKDFFLEPDSMKELFLSVLRKAKQKFDFEIENFCIMGNHYHLILKPGVNTNLSRLMQWIMSVFASTYNRNTGHSGHVWGERFFSRILGSLTDYLKVFDYIDQNPVLSGLVNEPAAWKYGGFWHFLHAKTDLLLSLPIVIPIAFKRYRRYLLNT